MELYMYVFCRFSGSTEGLAFIESLMDQMAYELNLDSMDVRLNNIPQGSKLIDYLGDLKEWANIDERKQEIATFNKVRISLKQISENLY